MTCWIVGQTFFAVELVRFGPSSSRKSHAPCLVRIDQLCQFSEQGSHGYKKVDWMSTAFTELKHTLRVLFQHQEHVFIPMVLFRYLGTNRFTPRLSGLQDCTVCGASSLTVPPLLAGKLCKKASNTKDMRICGEIKTCEGQDELVSACCKWLQDITTIEWSLLLFVHSKRRHDRADNRPDFFNSGLDQIVQQAGLLRFVEGCCTACFECFGTFECCL